jgi:hypothetical protein
MLPPRGLSLPVTIALCGFQPSACWAPLAPPRPCTKASILPHQRKRLEELSNHAVWGRNLDTDAGQDGDAYVDDEAAGDNT